MRKAMLGLRCKGKSVGFVPTMGALHEGHGALVKAARRENDFVAVSIFVNPAQFGPKEDFSRYPRPAAADRKLLKKWGVDYLFAPSAAAMYRAGQTVWVEPDAALTRGLCGKFRPGHFRGVATVVAKLFQIVQPARAYFGAKDYQQSVVIERMIEDLDFDIVFRRMPTVREKDGLALSSRNRYLSPAERRRAAAIPAALFALRGAVQAGRRDLSGLKQAAVRNLKKAGLRVQYFEIVDPRTLQPLSKVQPQMCLLSACFAGKTRLIDNVIIALS